jgi:hypothetical protein
MGPATSAGPVGVVGCAHALSHHRRLGLHRVAARGPARTARRHREDGHLRRRLAEGVPAQDGVRADRRARPPGGALRPRARAPGRARAPRLHPQPLARRAIRLRRGRQRHAQRARGGRARGHPPAARHDVGGRIRRVPGQPGAADRGRPSARRRRLQLRARQDRVGPPLPALGGAPPGSGDDDREAVHRVRAERGQLPPAAVDEAAVRGGHRRHDRPRHPVRA